MPPNTPPVRLGAVVAGLAILVGGLLAGLVSLAACNGCDTVLGQIRFTRVAYYGWAWETSGGTLEIKGVVPASSGEAQKVASTPPVAPCPPPADAVRYQQALYPESRGKPFRGIRPDEHRGPPAASGECVYDYDDDYCPGE